MRLVNIATSASVGVGIAAALTPSAPRLTEQHVIAPGAGISPFSCDLPPVAIPPNDGFPPARKAFGTKEALLQQVKRHTALVNVPSICYDDLGDFDQDPRWASFYEFHQVLEEQFPVV